MRSPEGDEGGPQENEGGEKRARILRAALEVCGRTGVTAARMEEIAALAEVSKGTLYRFFASKEDLLLATILSSYQQGLERVDADLGSARDPREQFQRLCEGLTDVLVLVGEHARVQYQAWGVVAGTPAFEVRLLDFLRSFHSERNKRTEEIVRAGQAAGVFRTDVSPGVVSDTVSAMVSGFIYRATFDPRGATREALRACLDTIVRGFLELPGGKPAEAGERGGE
jgi:AcrR family transcriptional regulator